MRQHQITVSLNEYFYSLLQPLAQRWDCTEGEALKFVLLTTGDPSGRALASFRCRPLRQRLYAFRRCLRMAQEAAKLKPVADQAGEMKTALDSLKELAEQAQALQTGVLEILQLASAEDLAELETLLPHLPFVAEAYLRFAKDEPDAQQRAAHEASARKVRTLSRLLRQLGLMEEVVELARQARQIEYRTPPKEREAPDSSARSPSSP